MSNGYKNPDILASEFYNKNSKLQTRIDFWNTFGTNSNSYGEVLKKIISGNYMNMIDIGCGNAQYSSRWLKYIKETATFLDISENMIKCARKNAKINNEKNIPIFLGKGSFDNTELANGTYDLVVAMHVLQHIDDVEQALKKIKAITSPKGTILITTYGYTLDDWLNRKHYELLEVLRFPRRMLSTKKYLSFSGSNAVRAVKKEFSEVELFTYNNDAEVSDIDCIMSYYTSSMMYRMSEGHLSTDIPAYKWEKLESKMRVAVEEELRVSGVIRVKGRVLIFRIIK